MIIIMTKIRDNSNNNSNNSNNNDDDNDDNRDNSNVRCVCAMLAELIRSLTAS